MTPLPKSEENLARQSLGLRELVRQPRLRRSPIAQHGCFRDAQEICDLRHKTPAALDPAHRIFIVSQVISSSTDDGTDCSLSPGDVLKRVDDTPDADSNVKVLVASSQKNDCGAGSQVPVGVQDLQDMHNDFRAKINEGLGKFAENQGKNGIPSGPPAGAKPNPAGQAQPDLTVESDLKSQQDEAGQAEKEVQDAASDNGGDDD